jgi:DNA repair exonuclease SbcCD ATPase subunit
LRALEKELESASRTSSGGFDAISEESLKEFKDSIDRIRHIVWPYVEAAAAQNNDLDTTLQRYRMERVTDMLENLKDRVATPDLQEVPEVRSFFTNIQQIATKAVEKHLERATKAGAKRPPTPQVFAVSKRLIN